jgi:hypothetical protein
MTPPRRLRLAAALALVGALTACTPIVALTAAPAANDPDCAAVSVRLPDSIEGLPLRETDAQATGAWGDPVSVLLACGVDVPVASELPCIEVNGVQWLRDDAEAPNYVFTSFGRDPAVRVSIDSEVIAPPGRARSW